MTFFFSSQGIPGPRSATTRIGPPAAVLWTSTVTAPPLLPCFMALSRRLDSASNRRSRSPLMAIGSVLPIRSVILFCSAVGSNRSTTSRASSDKLMRWNAALCACASMRAISNWRRGRRLSHIGARLRQAAIKVSRGRQQVLSGPVLLSGALPRTAAPGPWRALRGGREAAGHSVAPTHG